MRFSVALSLIRAAGDVADHWVQSDWCAQVKGATDRSPVTYTDERTDAKTVHGTTDGIKACAWHCCTYTATQGLVLLVGAKVLGVRLRPAAVAGALVISGLTHFASDRRVPGGRLERLAKKAGKARGSRPGRAPPPGARSVRSPRFSR
ncbi:hypothetical protein [Kitasatospora griseola]|uniref:hypothetical protein n=1 Tax=Kitasatospora griseola TaxID=2064 RepID=UPI00343556B8